MKQECFFLFVSLSIPVLSTLHVSPQPCKCGMLCLLLAIPSYKCKLGVLRHQGLCMFWKPGSGHAKIWLAKSERGLKTPAPDCMGSARLHPLCCKVNGCHKCCHKHFANGAGSLSNSSVCSEKPSHEDFHGSGQLRLMLVTWEYFCSGWNGIFSLKHPLFSLRQSLHLDVDANEKPNQYFFMVNILFLVWENKAPVCTKPWFVVFFCSCSDFDLST